jgi:hypothetical protein
MRLVTKMFLLASLLSGVLFTLTHAEPARILPQTPARVLFIGNSYTYFNGGVYAGLESLSIAAQLPTPIKTSYSIIGGATLQDHWVAGRAQDSIRHGNFNVVVLQDGTNPIGSKREAFFQYARLFKSLIDSVGAQPVFYMTWQIYYASLVDVSASYDSIGTELGVPVIPVGLAWQRSQQERPALNLYCGDNHHPNPRATYLNACVFFTSFTRQSPVGLPLYIFKSYDCTDSVNKAPALPTGEEVSFLQGIAWNTLAGSITGMAPQPHPALNADMTVRCSPTVNGVGHIALNFSRAQYIFLAIRDPQGRPVQQLQAGTLVAGKHQFAWGQNARPGVYLLEVKTERLRQITKIIKSE